MFWVKFISVFVLDILFVVDILGIIFNFGVFGKVHVFESIIVFWNFFGYEVDDGWVDMEIFFDNGLEVRYDVGFIVCDDG